VDVGCGSTDAMFLMSVGPICVSTHLSTVVEKNAQTQPGPRVRPFLPGKWRGYRRGDGEYMNSETATARVPKRAVAGCDEVGVAVWNPLPPNRFGRVPAPFDEVRGRRFRGARGLSFLSRATRTFRAMVSRRRLPLESRDVPGIGFDNDRTPSVTCRAVPQLPF
jgi:hypothetical protein